MRTGAIVAYFSLMADQPDPPDKWRVYEGDGTPDPEPPVEPPPPPVSTPHVPYGQQSSYNPVVITSSGSSGAAPKIILLVVALAVLGGVVAGAIAIISSVGGIDSIAGVDPKDPEDFAKMVDEIEEKTGSTEVYSAGLYDGFAIVYVPVDATDRAIGYRWDGGGVEEWTKTTSSDARFDLADIDPDVIVGMCEPVLAAADGATPGDCHLSIRRPYTGSQAWFSASASDEFGKYVSVMYDKNGVEIPKP